MSRDRGSATVWLVGLASLIGLVTTVAVAYGSAAVARHRVATAADLAALAGAVRVPDGPAAACAAAGEVAGRNGGSLARCILSGEDVEVEVSRPLVLGRLGSWTASASARAGPVDRTPPLP